MKTISLTCSTLTLCLGVFLAPITQAAESGDAMKHDAMMHKDAMKKSKHHKDSMHSDAIKHGDSAPQQQ